jgi:FkbM family methyltransferase
MKIFNRDLAMYQRNLHRIHFYGWYFTKCFFLFKNPSAFIRSYLQLTLPKDRLVRLRNGMTITLSEDPYDVATIFGIFVRKDYGDVQPGSVVIDIGANIGGFSLFAAACGARRVEAYEPNTEAFQCLNRNIRINHLETVIQSRQFAVTNSAGEKVRFPRKASPFNAILPDHTQADYETIETIDLPRIMQNLGRVQMLKLDCEGAEWDILFSSDRSVLSRFDAIRLEYHLGKGEEIRSLLERSGFIVKRKTGNRDAGIMWLKRSPTTVSLHPFHGD